jgi:pimeloyl-ACP methyl ester carboxylesterase
LLRRLATVSIGLFIAVALLAGAGLGYRAWRQHEAESQLAITTPSGIDEAMFVAIRGTEQWLTIRGRDTANPVMLVLHGGPGAALSPLATAFLAYENDYTVVQWDQPGAGKTFSRAGGEIPSTLTIAEAAADGVAVAEFVLDSLDKNKVILLGLSWGSVIGIEMARARPDLFAAYVGTGLFVHRDDSRAIAYDRVLAKARAQGNEPAVEELAAIGPPPYDTADEAGVYNEWASALGPANATSRLGPLLFAPRYSLRDVGSYLAAYIASDEHFDLGAVDLRTEGLHFALPVFVMQGADDFSTPVELAREYFDLIVAPQKSFVALEGGGHTALIDMPERFLATLNERVRPLAVSATAN